MLSMIADVAQSQGFAWVVLLAGLAVVVAGALRSGPGAFWGDMVSEDAED